MTTAVFSCRELVPQVEEGAEAPAAPAAGASGPSLSMSHKCVSEQLCESEKEEVAEVNKLTGSHRRTAFALTHEIVRLAVEFGLNRLAFFTLTFRDHVCSLRNADRRYRSLNRNILSKRYLRVVSVPERMENGRVHYHLVLVLRVDIRTGAIFEEFEEGDYRSANQALRDEWRFWRDVRQGGEGTAERYGFGRCELLPIKSTAEGIGFYVGKYIAKHIGARSEFDKGARLVRYAGFKPGDRKASSQFGYVGGRAWMWRRKTESVANDVGAKNTDDLKRMFGPRWAYYLQDWILSELLDGPFPSVHIEDLVIEDSKRRREAGRVWRSKLAVGGKTYKMKG